MNKLEQKFFNSYEDYFNEICEITESFTKEDFENFNLPIVDLELEKQVVISPYKVDFLYGNCVIELDGHDYHKTKEQRDYDYKRERYLQKLGYTVIRFTGTEVFLECRKCIIDMIFINNLFHKKLIDASFKGIGL